MAARDARADPAAIHVPVMADAVAGHLAPALERPGAVYVDGTLGMGGHARTILERNPQAVLVGIDRDDEALSLAQRRLSGFEGRVRLVRARFDELGPVLDAAGVGRIDAMLLDLGLSSLQIDHVERGFAYRVDAPLDMRMDTRGTVTAADVLNTYPPGELVRILREYGEERQARRIVRAIVDEREREPFTASARLVRTITAALPAAVRGGQGGHPARRVFQALRIEVNGELDALAGVLPVMLERMGMHARAVVLAYHSLEDRIVKRAFARAASDSAPAGLPVVPEHLLAQFRLLTHGAQRPTDAEIEQNPRAASARLRAIERTRPAPQEVC